MERPTNENLHSLYRQAQNEYVQHGYTPALEVLLDTLLRNNCGEFTFLRGADFERVRQQALKVGTPLANVDIVARLASDYFSSEIVRKQIKEHASMILNSGDILANYECYKVNKNLFRDNLELLNQPQDETVFKTYIGEKIKTMTSSSDVYELDYVIQKLNDVVLAREFLSKLKNMPIKTDEKAVIWERQAVPFVEAKDADESIWYLLNKPEYVPMDAYFDKLEQHVLDSQNGDFNFMFLAKYPNINFKAHEQVILNSTSGIAIRQFAGLFGGREPSNMSDKIPQRADLQGCINALSKADSERAIYSFAIHYDKFSDLNLQPVFERLKTSTNKNYSEYAKQMAYHTAQSQQM